MTINRYCEEYLAAGFALIEVSGKADIPPDLVPVGSRD